MLLRAASDRKWSSKLERVSKEAPGSRFAAAALFPLPVWGDKHQQLFAVCRQQHAGRVAVSVKLTSHVTCVDSKTPTCVSEEADKDVCVTQASSQGAITSRLVIITAEERQPVHVLWTLTGPNQPVSSC